jgi:hypothetical protein
MDGELLLVEKKNSEESGALFRWVINNSGSQKNR